MTAAPASARAGAAICATGAPFGDAINTCVLAACEPPRPSVTVSDAVNVPVIASGGASGPEDFVAAVRDGGADADERDFTGRYATAEVFDPRSWKPRWNTS